MSGRYAVANDWTPRFGVPAEYNDLLIIEEATLIDTRTGDRFTDGAQRVRMLKSVEGFKTKTFKGEMAWSDADRYANDVYWADRRRR